MELRSICKVIYRSLLSNKSKTFLIMPLKIFSHNDSMYLSARFAGKPGKIDTRREYDPLLAVHRLKRVEMTDQSFEFPGDYDFEQIYNRNFGIIKDNAFMQRSSSPGSPPDMLLSGCGALTSGYAGLMTQP